MDATCAIVKRIFFCGDPHGHLEHILAATCEHHPAAIVLLGDVQPQEPLEQALNPILDLTEVWWIHGNHDTGSDADYDNLFGSALADRNLHGLVVQVAGQLIAGLGGTFRGQIGLRPTNRGTHRQRTTWRVVAREIGGWRDAAQASEHNLSQRLPGPID